MSDSGDDGDTYGGEEASRYPQRPGYPQRSGWQGYYEEIPLEEMDLRTPGQHLDYLEMPRSPPYQQYESDEDQYGQGEPETGGFEVGGYEQEVYEQREDEPSFTRNGTPEPFLPPSQPDTPRVLSVSEPGSPSIRSVVSEDSPQASTFGMGRMLYPPMDDPNDYLQEDPSRGLSYATPTSAHGSMAAEGSPSPPGAGPVEASPSVQELSSAQYLYQRGEYSGTGQPQKRGRESSSSSSTGDLRPQRKHHHGGQGPEVPQSIPEGQQGHTSFLGISALGPGVYVQSPPQDSGGSYGSPDPHGRVDTSETQDIGQAYASQDVYQPEPNPFAGMQRSAPSSYTGGAGLEYAGPTQGEISAQGAFEHQSDPTRGINPSLVLLDQGGAGRGADQPQYHPMQPADPGAAPSNTGDTSGADAPRPQPQAPQRQAGSGGAGADQPNPMEGMGASGVWKFISGQEGGGEGDNWEGPRFKVDENKTTLWTPEQMHELQVIMASFESWDEVVSLGQPLPGQHSAIGSATKVTDLKYQTWSLNEDDEIRRLQSPWLEDRKVALQTLISRYDRWADEIIGRCMLFARSKHRLNLGIAPQTGVYRLKTRTQRQ